MQKFFGLFIFDSKCIKEKEKYQGEPLFDFDYLHCNAKAMQNAVRHPLKVVKESTGGIKYYSKMLIK